MKDMQKFTRIGVWAVLLLFTGAAAVHAASGYLGVSVERLSNLEKKEMGITHGILITGVEEKSPAEETGLKEDDVILYFNGKKIRRTDEFVEEVRDVKPNTVVKITLMRDKKRLDLDAKIGRNRTYDAFGLSRLGDFYGYMNRGYLGVRLHEMSEDLAKYFGVQEEGGALILSVVEDSPASEAGLKDGDVIIMIGGEEVGIPEDVTEILGEFEEGEEIEVTAIRQGQKVTVKAKLDDPSWESPIMIQGQGGKNLKIITEDLKRAAERVKAGSEEKAIRIYENEKSKSASNYVRRSVII